MVLPLLWFEAVGFNPDGEARCCEVLTAHLFGRARRIDRDCLFEPAPRFDRLSKRPRSDQAFPIRGYFFEADTGNASKLQHHSFEDNAEAVADKSRISVAQFEWRRNADCVETRREASGDAPEIRPPRLQASRREASSTRQRTSSPAGSAFARRLATLASVFVGAIPTETGDPSTATLFDAARAHVL